MTVQPRSLLDAFQPPEGLTGHTAVLVTMTADPDVLDAALHRFTGLSNRARARQGRVVAYLMRDARALEGRTDVLGPTAVCGLHELRPLLKAGRWPRTLHAKLALLTFSVNGRGAPTMARLVVTTGNFTRASLNHLLELVFVTDASLERDDGAGPADVVHAAHFLENLAQTHFEAKAERRSGAQSPLGAFDAMVRTLTRLDAGVDTRFFHSLHLPLLAGLRDRVSQQVPARRNLLLCGSGFMESDVDEEAGPTVLEELSKLPVLAQRARRVLIVPPETTGQLAKWAASAERSGWEQPIYACDATGRGRRLHAKYVLVGKLATDEHYLSSAHLYLGSGNLSRRGMSESGPEHGGNIECGVLISVGHGLDAETIKQKLFWDPEAEVIAEWSTVEAGQVPAQAPLIAPCPILHATTKAGQLRLIWSETACEPVRISADGHMWTVVEPTSSGPVSVTGVTSILHVQSLDSLQAWKVPVIDDVGRYAWPRDPLRNFDDLVAALRETAPEEEDDIEEDEEDDPSDASEGPGQRRGSGRLERRYPLRDMALFIEEVARRQALIDTSGVEQWLDQLEQLRDRPIGAALASSLRVEGIDVVAHLEHKAFAPPNMSAAQRRRYRRVLQELAERWGLR